MQVIRFGIDLAKSVFQVHGVDAEGLVVVQRQYRREEVLKFFAKQPPALIGLEACGSAHYWARELVGSATMPASYVKAYLRCNKNDARDAEACCEAVGRPTMRFVPVKTVDQQCARAIHLARDLMVRQRAQLANAIWGMLYEVGEIASKGSAWVQGVLARRPVKVAVVAQAAKTARIIWAVLTSGTEYKAPAAA